MLAYACKHFNLWNIHNSSAGIVKCLLHAKHKALNVASMD